MAQYVVPAYKYMLSLACVVQVYLPKTASHQQTTLSEIFFQLQGV